MLQEIFDDLLVKIGNPHLEHPIFYHSPVGIRFEIGHTKPIYFDSPNSENHAINPLYVTTAWQRTKAIYTALPHAPNLLRIDLYPNDEELEFATTFGMNIFENFLPCCTEYLITQVEDSDNCYLVLQAYWDLSGINFMPDLLLQEIIKADLGGISALASSVYFANTEDAYLYHVYDDRGADLVCQNKATLQPFYSKFNKWILDYDRTQIDALFAK